MRKFLIASFVVLAVSAAAIVVWGGAKHEAAQPSSWSFNATIIEACSCPMFCTCYFNTEPAGHAGHGHGGQTEHFCRFNNAFQVNKGSYGKTRLDGARFWVAGDLGGDFTKGMDWAVLTFDPSVSPEQREAIQFVLGKLYPVEWKSFTIAPDGAIEWKAGKDRAVARIDGGKTAEVILNRNPGMTDDPVVISNLRYWGAPRNDGFVLMPNEIETYRAGEKPFEYSGGNGFMITVDLSSKDY